MKIFAPSSYQELQQMFQDALEITDGPVCIRYPRTPAPTVHETEVGKGKQARKVQEGDDACILAIGKMLEPAKEAAKDLKQRGIGCSVWDVRCVAPIDGDMLEDAHRHPVVVTIEDGITEGGIGSTIQNKLSRFNGRGPIVRTMGVPSAYVPQGNADEILSHLGLDSEGITREILLLLEFSQNEE